jgi:hypothetical protein
MKPIIMTECEECEGSGKVDCADYLVEGRGGVPLWLGIKTCPACKGDCLLFGCSRCGQQHITEEDADDCCRNGHRNSANPMVG